MALPALVLDEPVDRWFSRPLARLLVPLLAATPITANQVTGLAALVGIGSGVALGLGRGPAFAVLTACFLVLDCCDGQLARLRGGGGMLGRVVDGIGDYLVGVAIHLGLVAWIARGHGWVAGVLWGFFAGASMTWCSYLLDKYKRRFKGEDQDPAELEAALVGTHGWRRALLLTMRPYMRRLAAERPPTDLATYQARARLPMRLFLLAGPTTHVTVWSVFAALGRPLEYAWTAVGPFTLLGLAAFRLQRRAERGAQVTPS